MKKIIIIICYVVLFLIHDAAQASDIVTYSHNSAGQLVSAMYESGDTNATVLYTYDENSSLIKKTSTFSTDGDGLDDTWEMDKFGDLDETATGDPDNDGLVNSNEYIFGSHPALADSDSDDADDYQEYIADTDPNNPTSRFEIVSVVISNQPDTVSVSFLSSAERQYTLQSSTNLTGNVWTVVPGQIDVPGSGITDILIDTNKPLRKYYNVKVEIPY